MKEQMLIFPLVDAMICTNSNSNSKVTSTDGTCNSEKDNSTPMGNNGRIIIIGKYPEKIT